jgi:serine/threonine protein kinase
LASEESVLRLLIPKVAEKLSFNYIIGSPFAIGGSGIVIYVEDMNLQVVRALKISRPSPGKERYLARVLIQETQTLRRLAHQNLIRIFAQGVVTLGIVHSVTDDPGTADARPVSSGSPDPQDFPFYVMEYVEGAIDSDKFLTKSRTQPVVLGVFSGILSAVEYLHSQDQIHMDIKPGNVLVTPAGLPILSDLGFAKKLKADDNATFIGGTEGYIHPEARKFVTRAVSDPNRVQGETPHSALKPAWGLYSLGKTFSVLLKEVEDHNAGVLSTYQTRYLKLLSARLLDGQASNGFRPNGITDATMEEIKYTSVQEARVDFDKLVGVYSLENSIPELNEHTQETIQASPTSVTPFTKRVKELVETPAVLRLGVITQLGLLNLIYPTANHTRLEHSVGAFSLCCRYVLALYYDAYNPLFRQLMNEADIKAVLLAALLHDLGQCPLAHDLEEADPESYSHESVAAGILRDEPSALANVIAAPEGWGISPEQVVRILEASAKPYKGGLRERMLRTLISGCIDCDKLAYLIRDSVKLGVPFGKGIDLERLLRCLTVVFREDGDKTTLRWEFMRRARCPLSRWHLRAMRCSGKCTGTMPTGQLRRCCTG